MEATRRLREAIRKWILLRRFRRPVSALPHCNCPTTRLANPEVLDLVTVAYNEPDLIIEQHKRLGQHLTDPYHYTVIDNSLDAAARQTILDWAQREGVAYVGLPLNPFSGRRPSDSHGLALNWTYEHYLKPRSAAYVGFLDHDLWPIGRVSVVPLLQTQPAFGSLQERGERWYLWPGFAFFRGDLLAKHHPDFMPSPGLDTGGGNWSKLFSALDRAAWRFPVRQYRKVADEGNAQADVMEMFDGSWRHLINGSNWAESEVAKKVALE
jgi:hypothetical protein